MALLVLNLPHPLPALSASLHSSIFPLLVHMPAIFQVTLFLFPVSAPASLLLPSVLFLFASSPYLFLPFVFLVLPAIFSTSWPFLLSLIALLHLSYSQP